VLDRESNRSEKKTGLSQKFSLFEENSELFDENNGKFWPKILLERIFTQAPKG